MGSEQTWVPGRGPAHVLAAATAPSLWLVRLVGLAAWLGLVGPMARVAQMTPLGPVARVASVELVGLMARVARTTPVGPVARVGLMGLAAPSEQRPRDRNH